MSEIVAATGLRPQSDEKRSSAEGRLRFDLGTIVVSGCMLASLLLVLAHFDAVELPGCGMVSDCTQAAESRWGTLPGTDWPLSFMGFAYFQALLAAFITSGGRLPTPLRVVVAFGAVASLVLTGVMLVEGYLCGYCLTVHAANLTLAGALLWPRQRLANSPPAIATIFWFAATFAVTSLLLGWLNHQSTAAAQQATRTQLETALGQQQPDMGDVPPLAPGRYVLGPESARVHVTVVSDYQCPSCRRIDAQLRAMTAGRDDVSISVRHFPFCTDYNAHVNKTRYPNACRAAIAAEAAGLVGGSVAFWKMHDWLFERAGQFNDQDLMSFIRKAGIDEAAFRAALADEATVEIIRADTAAADAAGLKYTPMVFINGREVRMGDASATKTSSIE